MTFSVEVPAVHAAARVVRVAADEVDALTPGAALNAVDSGIPSSRAAVSAHRVAACWAHDVAAWVRSAQDHAAALTSSADAYRGADGRGASRMRGGGR